jgi:hypothetical protein
MSEEDGESGACRCDASAKTRRETGQTAFEDHRYEEAGSGDASEDDEEADGDQWVPAFVLCA